LSRLANASHDYSSVHRQLPHLEVLGDGLLVDGVLRIHGRFLQEDQSAAETTRF